MIYLPPMPEIEGVILIDCWAPEIQDRTKRISAFYRRLVNFLKTMPIKHVIDASYSSDEFTPGKLAPYLYNELCETAYINTITVPADFLTYTQTHNVHNWLVAGQSWGVCVHHRPLGLANFCLQSKENDFFISLQSILDPAKESITMEHIVNDSLQWERYNNDLFKLRRPTNRG